MLSLSSHHDASDISFVVNSVEEMNEVIVMIIVGCVELIRSREFQIDHMTLSLHCEGMVLVLDLGLLSFETEERV